MTMELNAKTTIFNKLCSTVKGFRTSHFDSEHLDKERTICIKDENHRILRHLMRSAPRGYMTPTLTLTRCMFGYKLVHNMKLKTYTKTKDNLNFMTKNTYSNRYSDTLLKILDSTVRESKVLHNTCNSKAESDDSLLQFFTERTRCLQTDQNTCCKYQCKFTTSGVKLLYILKETLTVDLISGTKSYVSIDITPKVKCIKWNDITDRQTVISDQKIIVVNFSNVHKCIHVLHFAQKSSKLCYNETDITISGRNGTNSDIETDTLVTFSKSGAFFSPPDSRIFQTSASMKTNCSKTLSIINEQHMKDWTEFFHLFDTLNIKPGNIVQDKRLFNTVSSEIFQLKTDGISYDRSELNPPDFELYNKASLMIPDCPETSNLQTDVPLPTGYIETDSLLKNCNIESNGFFQSRATNTDSFIEKETQSNSCCFKVQNKESKPVIYGRTKIHDGFIVSLSNDKDSNSIKSVAEKYLNSLEKSDQLYNNDFVSKKERDWYSDFGHDILLYPVFRPSLESSFHQLLNGGTRTSTNLMCYEFHRLNSFSDFSNEWSPSRIKLARDGWFSTGNGREAKCFSCGVYYDSWTYDSDPIQIHKALSSCCSMVNGINKDNVPISQEIRTEETLPNGVEANANGYQQLIEHSYKTTVSSKEHSDYQTLTGVINNETERCDEQTNVSIPSVDQLSISNTFQNLGVHTQVGSNHNKFSKPETNHSTLNGSCSDKSDVSSFQATQSVVVGAFYNGSEAVCLTDTTENKVNQMNKSKQGVDGVNQAANGYHLVNNPNPSFQNADHFEKRRENNGAFKEIPIYTLPSVQMIDPKYPQYINLNIRISSFRGWPSYLNQSERDLAMAGFFYKGYSDGVTCYQCGITLAKWQEDDDGFVEHAKWKPDCYYIRQYKGDEFVRLVQAAKNQIEIHDTPIDNGHKELPVLTHKTPAKRNQRNDIKNTLMGMGFNDKEVEKSIDTYHVRSGLDFGDKKDININEILEILYEDQTTSSETERAVTDGSPPMSSGNNISFNTSSIESTSLLGDGPISSLIPSSQLSQRKNHTQLTQNQLEIKTNLLEKDSNNSRPEIERGYDNNKSVECKICLDEEVGMIFTPCGHICACVTCSQKINKCPICRKHIQKKIRGYLT